MLLPEDTSCCLVTVDDYIVVFTERYVVRYGVQAGEPQEMSRSAPHPAVEMTQLSQVRVNPARGLAYLSDSGACWTLSLNTGLLSPTYIQMHHSRL